MTTKKITNIARADLASLIEGYSASQHKVGVLSKSDANIQSKEPATDSPQSQAGYPNRLINRRNFHLFPPNASAKNNGKHHWKNTKTVSSFHRKSPTGKPFISPPKPATDWTRLSADWENGAAAFRDLSRTWQRNIWKLIMMKLSNGKGCKSVLEADKDKRAIRAGRNFGTQQIVRFSVQDVSLFPQTASCPAPGGD